MSDTDEVPPLRVNRNFQWKNLARYAKWTGAAVVAFVVAVMPVVSYVRVQNAETSARIAEAADKRAKQAKQSAEAGFQVTREYVQGLEHRLAVLEAAAKRAQPDRGRSPRRPLPVVAPPRPAPLPRDLNSAEAQVAKTGGGPVIVPLLPDGGTR